ncbi:Permease of the drug/metabolite transporter (DMT) superfamily [hydrothermal vent metagenome]|uniref:Permease of the drug/metabolite transporter (DMT) superfamily n=1 Tax=hydrothermal vent metagenome TaxID=652676 RepID=A0A3B0S526_9ZZZZ
MGTSSRTQIYSVVALAVLAVLWGAIPLFVRNDVPAVGLVGVRVTFGALALIAVAAALRKLVVPKVRRWRLVLSGVLLAAHWITFFQSIKLTTVAVALAVLYIGPIAAAILSGPLLGEHVAPRLWGALGIAGAGTVFVVQPWVEMSQQDGVGITAEGVMVAGLSAALLTALMLVGKPIAKDLGGLTMAIGELTVASILLAPATYQAVTQYSEFMINFLVLGAFFTGFAGFVYWEAMRHLPVAVVSVIMYLEPATAVMWAAVFLGETPNVTTWFGVGLVVVGGAVAATVSREKDLIGAPAAL